MLCVCCTHPLLIHPLPLQRQKDLNNVNDTLAGLHKSVARASALPDYKEKKAEYVSDAALERWAVERGRHLPCAPVLICGGVELVSTHSPGVPLGTTTRCALQDLLTRVKEILEADGDVRNAVWTAADVRARPVPLFSRCPFCVGVGLLNRCSHFALD